MDASIVAIHGKMLVTACVASTPAASMVADGFLPPALQQLALVWTIHLTMDWVAGCGVRGAA
jgi:hypothetical protein